MPASPPTKRADFQPMSHWPICAAASAAICWSWPNAARLWVSTAILVVTYVGVIVDHVNRAIAALLGAGLMIGPKTSAQTATPQESTPHVISDQDLDLLRKDIRSQRKQLIASNLKLTDQEATKFWPVYDQYVSELITINDRKFGLIQEYADSYGKLTNEQSLSFVRRWLDADIEIAQLRQKYVAIVSKVLDGKKSATFFQLDRRIAMMIELQLSSRMPLVQSL